MSTDRVKVEWTDRARITDANGKTLQRPGDEGVLEREAAEVHSRRDRCDIIGEVETSTPTPKRLTDGTD